MCANTVNRVTFNFMTTLGASARENPDVYEILTQNLTDPSPCDPSIVTTCGVFPVYSLFA